MSAAPHIHRVRLTGHLGATLYGQLSRICCCLLDVGQSLGTKYSGKNPLLALTGVL
jgi:hypothetical protein